MKYQVTEEDAVRVVSEYEGGEYSSYDSVVQGLQRFVDQLPEPADLNPIKWIEVDSARFNVRNATFLDANGLPTVAVPTAPKWIRVDNAMINVDTIIFVEDTLEEFTIFTNAVVEGSDGVWSIRNLDAIKALRAFFFDSGRFPHIDLTPKGDA